MNLPHTVIEVARGISLKDLLIMVVCFKIINPMVMQWSVLNSTEIGKYIAALVTLLVVPLLFDQRTPSVSHFFDSGDPWALKILVAAILARVVVTQPKPTIIVSDSIKKLSQPPI
jgi:hypothetical protein